MVASDTQSKTSFPFKARAPHQPDVVLRSDLQGPLPAAGKRHRMNISLWSFECRRPSLRGGGGGGPRRAPNPTYPLAPRSAARRHPRSRRGEQKSPALLFNDLRAKSFWSHQAARVALKGATHCPHPLQMQLTSGPQRYNFWRLPSAFLSSSFHTSFGRNLSLGKMLKNVD